MLQCLACRIVPVVHVHTMGILTLVSSFGDGGLSCGEGSCEQHLVIFKMVACA